MAKRIGIVMAMAYGAWMLYGNVHQLVPALHANLDLHKTEAGPRKLDGSELERLLAESNAFGKAALARMLWCTRDYGLLGRWDAICQIGGGMDGKTRQVMPGGMKFGLRVDSEHIVAMSDLYPADGDVPLFAKSTTIAPDEPAREQLPCGVPGYTATYFPETKFFGPALSVTFRGAIGVTYRSNAELAEVAKEALQTCIQFVERTKPLTRELPATAWHADHMIGLPDRAEHLVYDPRAKHVRISTERTSQTPVWR